MTKMRITPHERALRYRRLALAENDPQKVRVLQMVAEESEKCVLFTAQWMTASAYTREQRDEDAQNRRLAQNDGGA